AIRCSQLVIFADRVVALDSGAIIFGLPLIFLDYAINIGAHDMGDAGPMLLGGVLKLVRRRDRRTLWLLRLGVLGLGSLLLVFLSLASGALCVAVVAFGLVRFRGLRGLGGLSILFPGVLAIVCGGLLGLGLRVIQRLRDRIVARLGLLV